MGSGDEAMGRQGDEMGRWGDSVMSLGDGEMGRHAREMGRHAREMGRRGDVAMVDDGLERWEDGTVRLAMGLRDGEMDNGGDRVDWP